MMGQKAPGDMIATGIGSLPHGDPRRAVGVVLEAVPMLPYWPQLPRRDPRENMYRQFLGSMPGVVEGDGPPAICDWSTFWAGMEDLLAEFMAATATDGGEHGGGAGFIAPERAAGLWELARAQLRQAVGVKGQVTGPVSMGLSIMGPEGKAALYDERLMEAITSLLYLKLRWQEDFLRALHPQTLVFLDEPYLGTLGSGFYAYDAEKTRRWLQQVLAAARGLTGIHCCANTDWGLLMDLGIDVISFDAYFYFDSFALYSAQLSEYLARGGIIAWGIVPAGAEALATESALSLARRLEDYVVELGRRGLPEDRLIRQSLVTPSCGLGSLPEAEAERALELCGRVAGIARERFGLDGK